MFSTYETNKYYVNSNLALKQSLELNDCQDLFLVNIQKVDNKPILKSSTHNSLHNNYCTCAFGKNICILSACGKLLLTDTCKYWCKPVGLLFFLTPVCYLRRQIVYAAILGTLDLINTTCIHSALRQCFLCILFFFYLKVLPVTTPM